MTCRVQLARLAKAGELVVETPPDPVGGGRARRREEQFISSPEMNRAERDVAFAVRRRLAPTDEHDAVYGQYVPQAREQLAAEAVGPTGTAAVGASLAPAQRDAVRRASRGKLLLLTGGK